MKNFLRPYTQKSTVLGMVLLAGAAGALGQGLQVGSLMEENSPLLLRTSSKGYLGVYLGDVDQDRAQALHVSAGQGAEITLLDHDAPGAKMGLRVHDVVVEMDGTHIQNADQLRKLLRGVAIGHKVELVISREGAQQTIAVQLADRRKVQEEAREQIGTGSYSTPAMGFLSGGDTSQPPSGFHLWTMGKSLNVGALVEPLTPQMAEFLGVENGLIIKSVANKSAAFAAGLKPHDVILHVGGEGILTSSDWERALRASEGKPVQVEILRDRTKQLVLLQVAGKH